MQTPWFDFNPSRHLTFGVLIGLLVSVFLRTLLHG